MLMNKLYIRKIKAIERYNEAKNGKADPKMMNFIKETIVNNN